jgi:esterase/lipase superfamily enzyme
MRRNIWSLEATRGAPPVRIARWGHFGRPVLLFPSAGADYLEVERFGLIAAAAELITAGRIKVYSVDGAAARAWLQRGGDSESGHAARRTEDERIDGIVVPHVRRDCQSSDIEIIAAGAALGAYSAVAMLCRAPQTFCAALGMSGVFERLGYLRGPLERTSGITAALPPLATLVAAAPAGARARQVRLAVARGDFEDPAATARVAETLRGAGIPHRVELWGEEHAHSWSTWRAMLPQLLAELT